MQVARGQFICAPVRPTVWSMKLPAVILEDGSPGSPALTFPPALIELGNQMGWAVASGKTPLAGGLPDTRTPSNVAVSQVKRLSGERRPEGWNPALSRTCSTGLWASVSIAIEWEQQHINIRGTSWTPNETIEVNGQDQWRCPPLRGISCHITGTTDFGSF